MGAEGLDSNPSTVPERVTVPRAEPAERQVRDLIYELSLVIQIGPGGH